MALAAFIDRSSIFNGPKRASRGHVPSDRITDFYLIVSLPNEISAESLNS